MSIWSRLLEAPPAEGHLVQFYGEDSTSVIQRVATYLWEGLKRGDSILMVAQAHNTELLEKSLRELGTDIPAGIANGSISILDGAESLAKLSKNGVPDWSQFENVVQSQIETLGHSSRSGSCRAYGEMVDILWQRDQVAEADLLERFWGNLLGKSKFRLFCSYKLDVFGGRCTPRKIQDVLCSHSHVLPATTSKLIELAIRDASHRILRERVDPERMGFGPMDISSLNILPDGAALSMWIQNTFPQEAPAILGLAQSQLSGY